MNKEKFFSEIRKSSLLGPILSKEEVQGIEAILDATSHWPISHIAYALATTYHETATTMQPISERGAADYFEHMYGINGKNPKRAELNGNIVTGDGTKYRGRGFVQLTWKNNYLKLSQIIGLDLVSDPDLAMKLDIAARILEYGMSTGIFTGKKLSDYLPTIASKDHFTRARRVINGIDKAAKIADYAVIFQKCIQEANK